MTRPTPRAKKQMGERIRAMRQERGLKQKEVSGYLNTLLGGDVFRQGHISKMEFGDREVSREELDAIAVVLDCDIYDLDPDGTGATDTPRRVIRGAKRAALPPVTTTKTSAALVNHWTPEESIKMTLFDLLSYMTTHANFREGALRMGGGQWLRYRIEQEPPWEPRHDADKATS